MNSASLNQWFPLEQQNMYVSKLIGRHGLTRRRAEYFVRLWAYLQLKQQQLGKRGVKPLTQLVPLQEAVPCTHREAAEIFYAQKDRGSERSAGMMLDRFAALGLIKKKFDGNTICIEIRPLAELIETQLPKAAPVECDAFNPRTDAVSAANLIVRNYTWMPFEPTAAHKITRLLRDWAQQYVNSMRVLRRSDDRYPVGFYMLYPTARESEGNFFLSPSQSVYLVSETKIIDPLQMAVSGDRDCTCAFIRAWSVDPAYTQHRYICQMVEDVQHTLIKMQQDFPNLCDLYGMLINPIHEELRLALGFQKTYEDTKRSLHWFYQPVDRFLALDVERALANLKLDRGTHDT